MPYFSTPPTHHPQVRIKCHHGQDIRVLLVPRSLPFLELKAKIEKKLSLGKSILKYRDDVGDLITIASHEEWEEALVYTHSHTAGKFDLFIEDEKVAEKPILEKRVSKEKDPIVPSKASMLCDTNSERVACAWSLYVLRYH